jgi:hypothetical protein
MLVLSAPAAAQPTGQWLCISDQATGFTFESGKWRPTNFKAGDRYIIRRSKLKGVAWEVQNFGSKDIWPVATCDEDFNSYKFLFCHGFYEFKFNAASNRFLKAYLLGYYTNTREGEDTPSIEIGTCSEI